MRLSKLIFVQLVAITVSGCPIYGATLSGKTASELRVVENYKFKDNNGTEISGNLLVETYSVQYAKEIYQDSFEYLTLPENRTRLPEYLKNWAFVKGENFQGNFIIDNYSPCTPDMTCRELLKETELSNRIGATFLSVYLPPTPNTNLTNFEWIQIVNTNFGGAKIDLTTIFENAPIDPQESYYGLDISKTSLDPFYQRKLIKYPQKPGDYPYFLIEDVPNLNLNNIPNIVQYPQDWKFQTYLAKRDFDSNGNPKATIYDGFTWGWRSKFEPKQYQMKSSLSFDTIDEFELPSVDVTQPLVAWIDENITDINGIKKDISLALVDDTGKVIDYSDGETLFDDKWGTGITSIAHSNQKIKLKVANSSDFIGNYTLNVKLGEKDFSFLSSQFPNLASTSQRLQPSLLSSNLDSAETLDSNTAYFSLSSTSSQSVPEPGTIVGLAGMGILGFLTRKKKKP